MLNNQKKNVKNKNERSEVDVLSGFSVYHDDKNRTIYYNRLNHRGYVIKPRDFTTFRTFSKRLFAALAVIVLMFSFENAFNTMPYIPIGVGILVYAIMQFKFYSFLHQCTMVANFDPKKAYGQIQILSVTPMRSLLLRALLYILLAVLIVYHTLTNLEYTTLTLALVIAFAVYAVFQSVILIAAAFYKKNHPDLNLDFITEDRGPRKKSRS